MRISAAKKRKKKKHYRALTVIRNCGGKKCGSAFEWKVIDLAISVHCKKTA